MLGMAHAQGWRIGADFGALRRNVYDFEGGRTEVVTQRPDLVGCFCRRRFAWVFGSGGIVLGSDNGGNRWTVLASDPALYPASVSFADVNEGWMVAHRGPGSQLLLQSHDGGRTWVDLGRPREPGRFAAVSFVNRHQGWLAGSVWTKDGDSGAIWSSSNGGATWRLQYTDNDVTEFISIRGVNARNAWGIASDAVVSTADGGRTWQHRFRSERLDVRLREIDVTGLPGIWLLGDVLLRSIDGGNIWAEVALPAASPATAMTFVGNQHGWISEGARIWETLDGGKNWHAQDPAPAPITRLCASETNVVALTTHAGQIAVLPRLQSRDR